MHFLCLVASLLITQGIMCQTSAPFAENFAALPEDQKQALLQSYSMNDIQYVHDRLREHRNNLQKQFAAQTSSRLQQDLTNIKLQRPISRDSVREEGDSLHEVNRKANTSAFMYQGDILLTVVQVDALTTNETASEQTPQQQQIAQRKRRQAYRDGYYPRTTWGSTLYYYFDPSASATIQSSFREAVKFWQTHTCINFEENRNAADRVRVFSGQGCYSFVGRTGGDQELSLGKGCESVGTAAHELGHALGFFHTQSRWDRDDYININFRNIQPDYVDQFDKETQLTNYNYGMPYDYGSVMQYGATSASKNYDPTMVAKDSKYEDTMGSDIVAFYDVAMMNEHYNCKARCVGSTITCQNGGVINSNTCKTCLCPSGYGGDDCGSRPAGCGSVLTATTTMQYLQDSLGDFTFTPKQDFTFCNYWIQAPAGSKIEVTISSMDARSLDGCVYGGVEIKTHPDQKLTGYRFCSRTDAGQTLTSTGNLVPVITYNRYSRSSATLGYRIVSGTDATNPRTNPNPAPNGNGINFPTFPAPNPFPGFPNNPPAPPQQCRDYNRNCASLVPIGFCTNPFYPVTFVASNCARSCNLCSS